MVVSDRGAPWTSGLEPCHVLDSSVGPLDRLKLESSMFPPIRAHFYSLTSSTSEDDADSSFHHRARQKIVIRLITIVETTVPSPLPGALADDHERSELSRSGRLHLRVGSMCARRPGRRPSPAHQILRQSRLLRRRRLDRRCAALLLRVRGCVDVG